ncbi:MAG: protein kinase domain-containing protein [Armatimonadota bacterium]
MIGQIVNYRYEVLEKIGDGEFFSVYRSRDKVLNRLVALKILNKDLAANREFAAAIESSYRDAARLAHPNLARVLDADSSMGDCVVACEFARGTNVKERLRKAGTISVPHALDIAISVLEALEYAHANQVVHGDIRPQDIIVSPDGEVKLTDFGLAAALANCPAVAERHQMRSIHYQAPEVIEGNPATAASDVYSVGVVLYEMLTNSLPFDGGSAVSIALKKVKELPVAPRSINAAVPKSLNDVILKALEPLPKDRYSTASTMLADLRVIRDGLRVGQTPVVVEPAAPTREVVEAAPAVEADSLSRGYWWLLAVFVLAVMVSFGLALLIARPRAQIQVPQFVGKTWEEAQAEAEARGIELIDDGRVYSDTYEAGKICSAVPPAGTMVPRGEARVRVKISLGPSTVPVPDLVGMSEADANEAAVKAGFIIGKVTQQYSDKVPVNAVISQNPEPGLRRAPNTTIDLVISQGPKPRPTEPTEEPVPPPAAGERRFNVDIEVPPDADGPQEVLIKVVDINGENTVYREIHDPGNKFRTTVTAQGPNIRIKVYIGGVLVRDVSYR